MKTPRSPVIPTVGESDRWGCRCGVQVLFHHSIIPNVFLDTRGDDIDYTLEENIQNGRCALADMPKCSCLCWICVTFVQRFGPPSSYKVSTNEPSM